MSGHKIETIWLSISENGPKKSCVRKSKMTLDQPHEKDEIQRKTYRTGKNLTLTENTLLEKKKSLVEGDPMKSWSEVEAKN